jgi:2,3-bisphosphoglycerate-dependent phosphoglycerate mutase
VTVIYLVRHAHADWRPGEDRPLSVQGQQDAQRVAVLLGGLPIGALYASPARRALQTIQPLAETLHLPVHIRVDLLERRLGNPAVDNFEAAVRQCWEHPELAHPGGESSASALERIVRAHPGAQVGVATHGNLLALILQHFDPTIDYAFWQGLSMPDIYRLELGEGGQGARQRVWRTEGEGLV